MKLLQIMSLRSQPHAPFLRATYPRVERKKRTEEGNEKTCCSLSRLVRSQHKKSVSRTVQELLQVTI